MEGGTRESLPFSYIGIGMWVQKKSRSNDQPI